jgi:Zn-dependent M32 family carboxypeptidase
MPAEPHDPRDIPILTDAVRDIAGEVSALDVKSVHAAILTETLELADSLLHQAAKDIEATLFERVYDRLRARLPELVDRILREHAATRAAEERPVTANPASQDDPQHHG